MYSPLRSRSNGLTRYDVGRTLTARRLGRRRGRDRKSHRAPCRWRVNPPARPPGRAQDTSRPSRVYGRALGSAGSFDTANIPSLGAQIRAEPIRAASSSQVAALSMAANIVGTEVARALDGGTSHG